MNSTRGKESKIRVLVACADYPNPYGNVAMMYVHVRNKYYVMHNIDVTVLNFQSSVNYTIDGIKVISLKTYKHQNNQYDLLICHAPNIRRHYLFLKRYGKMFPKFMFFFHGHEVLRTNEVYPKPYDYIKHNSEWIRKFKDIYDFFKLKIWHNYFRKVVDKSEYIFVSECFFKEFKNYIKLGKCLENKVHIIYNSISDVFEQEQYVYAGKKEYDFITIRSNLDSSVYCIDLLMELAERYPEYRFLVIGKGRWFEKNKKPENVIWINQYLEHKKMLKYINSAKCALMLTRRDTQGVMSCELATYGIPIVTSELEICREVLGDFENVSFIENDLKDIHLSIVYDNLVAQEYNKKSKKFNYENTVKYEEALIKGCRNM